jgi:hypothetical protein
VNGKENQARRVARIPQSARRFNAVEFRHGDVEHDDIRIEPLCLSEECESIGH